MRDHLPGVLSELMDIIGGALTLKLVDRYGGTRLYIPKTITSDHHIARIIGAREAQALADHFSCEQIEIPKAARARAAIRNRKIRLAVAAGKSRSEIALQFGLTERQIGRIAPLNQSRS